MATARTHALSVWLMLYALLAFTAGVSAAPFVSPKGYQLAPPDGWKATTGFQGSDVLLSAPPVNGFSSNFNITTHPGPSATAEQIRAQYDNIKTQFNAIYAQDYPDAQFISQKQATVDGTPALDTTFKFSKAVPGAFKQLLRIRQVIVFHPGTLFTLTCTTSEALHDNYDAAFDGIISSLHWTDGAGQQTPPIAAGSSAATAFHSAKGYQITPPDGWTAKESNLKGADLALAKPVQSGPPPRLRITVNANMSNSTLEAFQKSANVVFPRDFPHYSLVSQDYFQLDGVRALGTKFTNTNKDGQKLLVRQIHVHNNGLVYSLTFAVPYENRTDYEAAFTNMIKSFHWTH